MLRGYRALSVGIVGLVSAAALLFAPTAGANHLESGMAVSISDSAKLVDGVYLVVPVTITCPAIDLTPTQFIQQEFVDISVRQKSSSSKVIATGHGGISYYNYPPYGQTYGTPLACDGSPHTYSVEVDPDSTGYFPITPFKGGKAVANAHFEITVLDSSTGQGDYNALDIGPISISIKG